MTKYEAHLEDMIFECQELLETLSLAFKSLRWPGSHGSSWLWPDVDSMIKEIEDIRGQSLEEKKLKWGK